MREHFHPELRNAKYVAFIDADGRYTDCSDGVMDLVGYTRAEILDRKIENLSFDKSRVPPLFEQYKRDGSQDGDYILQHKNGTPVLIHYKAWIFADGCHAAVWEPADEWEQLLFEALIETDSTRLRAKVDAAQGAIHKHQSTLGAAAGPEIRQKLRDGSQALRALTS